MISDVAIFEAEYPLLAAVNRAAKSKYKYLNLSHKTCYRSVIKLFNKNNITLV